MGHTFHTYQKMRKKISHGLIPMSSMRATGEIWFWIKNWPKIKITGVDIAWVEPKSIKYPKFYI